MDFFLNKSNLILTGSAIVIGAFFFLIEWWRPKRHIDLKKVLPNDIAACVLYECLIFPLALTISDRSPMALPYVPEYFQVSWPLRLLAYYILVDFCGYWLHRFMHTKHIWRVHKWHHSPQYMYWFMGVRATLPQQVINNLPAVFAVPMLTGAPSWIFIFFGAELTFRNAWMHMNVVWRSNWLEWVFVTPRSHHIHHSERFDLHNGNYGVLFSFWDRIFGTWINPDGITDLTFGTGSTQDDSTVRVILGI